MNSRWIFLSVMLSTALVAAPDALLTLTPGQRSIAMGTTPVNLSVSGVLKIPNAAPIRMTTIGGGLRRKKVLLTTVDVYVAQFLVDAADVSKFVKTAAGALASTDQIPTVSIHLTFARSLTAQQLSDGLNEAMAANGYKVNENADLKALASAISATGTINKGATAVLTAQNVDAQSDVVIYQSPWGIVPPIKGKFGLKHALMCAWLGKPADDGLRALRDQMFGS